MEKSNLCNDCNIEDCPARDIGKETDSIGALIDDIVNTLMPDAPVKKHDFNSFDRMVKKILEHYGFTSQLKKTEEEANELIAAIRQYCTDLDVPSAKAEVDLIGEMADVMILIQQLALMLGVDKLNEHIEFKLKRQMKRIEEEKAQRKI